jgi:hypothetical protein
MNLEVKIHHSAGGSPVREKRREPRRKTSLDARVRPAEDPDGPWLQVRLVDVSESGFRVSHLHTGFVSGQLLEFRHPYASGRARVVWNRMVDSNVETGCVVLTRA